jgi:hypothetical protein
MGVEPAEIILTSMENATSIINYRQYLYIRQLYQKLRQRSFLVIGCHGDKSDDDSNASFYEELHHMFNQFPKNHLKHLVKDFKAKSGR